ncbi:DMP19 family protein [Halovulum sp. GXIMD14794]
MKLSEVGLMFGRLKLTSKSIPVPDRTVAAGAEVADLPKAAIEFVERMIGEGGYLPEDLLPEALQISAADVYVGEVNNGGHAQFAHNSRLDPALIERAIAGLKGGGLHMLATCLETLKSQSDAGPVPDMKALDDAFFSESDEYPEAIHAWIRPLVTPLSDRAYTACMKRLLKRDADRNQRVNRRVTSVWHRQLLDENRIGFNLAARSNGLQHTVYQIHAGQDFLYLGQDVTAWSLTLAGGQSLWGCRVPGFAVLHPEQPSGHIVGLEKMRAFLMTPLKASDEEIADARASTVELTPAPIAVALLERARIPLDQVRAIGIMYPSASWDKPGSRCYAIHLKGGRALRLRVAKHRAELINKRGWWRAHLKGKRLEEVRRRAEVDIAG